MTLFMNAPHFDGSGILFEERLLYTAPLPRGP
jgi:hypothetical protein